MKDNTKVTLTLKQLRKLVRESSGGVFQPFVVQVIDDKEILGKYKQEIFALIQTAYARQGGFLGADKPNKLIKDTDRAKLVFDASGCILACALYRTDLGGFKRFASAGRTGKAAMQAVNAIVKSDIEPYDGWYWVEASGIIEKLFKRNKGNPIPNTLAPVFLKIKEGDSDFEQIENDPVHYKRTIKGSKKTKMLFGFKDEASKMLAEGSVEDYGAFKLDIDGSDKRINEAEDSVLQSVEEASLFLSRLFDLHYEQECNEMLPEWSERLARSMHTIEEHLDEIPPDMKSRCLSALQRGRSCKENMTVLRFKKISL